MKSKIINYGAAIVILIAAIFWSSFMIKNKNEPKRDAKQKDILYVKAEKAVNSNISSEAKYRGRVASFGNVSLSAEVSGKILGTKVALKEGESFNKGDLLVKIYNDDAFAALRSSRSSYLQLLSGVLPDMKVDFPDEYDKWYGFFSAIDLNEYLPELPSLNSDKEKIFMASRNILTQYYSINQQEIKYHKYELYAPFKGSYKKVNSEVGSVASMNMQIASLIRTDILEVIVPVLPEDTEWINEGMNVVLSKNSGIALNGKVSRVADFIDPTSQTVKVYVSVKNTGKKSLLEGEYVEAEFISSQSITGMKIPREALVGNNSVYVVQNSKLDKKQIKVIDKLDDYLIIAGFNEGDLIVTESLLDIKPDQIIKVLNN